MKSLAIVMVVLGACLACASVACGNGEESPAPTDSNAIATTGVPQPSERQRAILDQEEITFADYEEAFFAMYRCMEDAGIQFSDSPRLDSTGTKYIVPGFWLGTGDEDERNRGIHERCWRTHFLGVQAAWDRMHSPSEQQRQEALSAMEACLIDGGVSVPEPLTSEQDFATRIGEAPEVFSTCIQRVSDEYRMFWTLN